MTYLPKVIASVLLMFGVSTQAAVVQYENYLGLGGFVDALTGSPVTHTFDALSILDTDYGASPFAVAPFLVVDDVKFTPGASAFVLSTVSNPSYGIPFFSAQGGDPNVLNVSLTTGVTAIGFFYGSYNGESSSFSASVNSGAFVASGLSLPGTTNTTKFIGFTSTLPITSIVFTQAAGANFDVTTFVTGSAAPVPEPSMALMFGVGLALMGAVARRKRA